MSGPPKRAFVSAKNEEQMMKMEIDSENIEFSNEMTFSQDVVAENLKIRRLQSTIESLQDSAEIARLDKTKVNLVGRAIDLNLSVGEYNGKKIIYEMYCRKPNHNLARPEDKYLLRLCKNISDEKASVLKIMIEAGIRTLDAFFYLAEEVEGIENVRFSKNI
ncbi:hypothetical protein IEQ34_012873 [Dendrobium chrysotoxum]|uniref:Uncharacterized protein n=1 Tax=Dendrobium chrysotoxum TaxID=161865 RepID=A0AAV7GPD0_DENCH|nr:hypothetical protein IEQ34_012873 [Dendrobium chrysotoxum]